MITTRTDEEILEKVRAVWPDENSSWGKIDVEINRTQKDIILLKLSKMYEAPGVTFLQIQALAKFFDTLNVETESEFSSGGCDTCDYGSKYGFYLRVSSGAPYKELE